jgi:hypothetical protein
LIQNTEISKKNTADLQPFHQSQKHYKFLGNALHGTAHDVKKFEGLQYSKKDTFSSMFMTVLGFFLGHNCFKLSS